MPATAEAVVLDVEHETVYRYGGAVEWAQHQAFLRPRGDRRQQLQRFVLDVDPTPTRLAEDRDRFGNVRHSFTVVGAHHALHVRAASRVRVAPRALPPPEHSAPWEQLRERLVYRRGCRYEPASEFAVPSPYVPRLEPLRDYALRSFAPRRPAAAAAIELMQRLHADFAYASASTAIDTPLAAVWQARRGVCQDFAHLLIGALRMLGLPARYVSGYLLTRPPPGHAPLVGADASHAWVAMWCPGGAGDGEEGSDDWLELDPTNACLPGADHVRVAIGRDYGDVTPLRGVIRGGGAHELDVRVTTLRCDPAQATAADAAGTGVAWVSGTVESQAMRPGYDEMYASDQAVREHYRAYARWLQEQPHDAMMARRAEAEMIFRRVGITFAVYGAKDDNGAGAERLIPFDLIPRIIPGAEWRVLERGLRQRVTALNRFLHDVYHGQEILEAGVVPAEQVLHNAQYRREMIGVDVPGGVYSHVAGVDIVRAAQADGSGKYHVLEDNLRVPSGVSYMLENRKMTMRLFPELFAMHRVAPVAHYPDLLLETLRAVAPAGVNEPTVVVLTPGMYNSAYFEHAFLAQQMGVELVEGQDLFVREGFVYMRTTRGPRRVDVVYRRVDDDFLDPAAFRADSLLGCAGLLDVYRRGNVALCNAIGTGVADDKSIYPYVPRMIEFYLGETPILHNVPTYSCRQADDLEYVLDHLGELVVKEVHGAGGYGMLVGPAATAAEIAEFRKAIAAHPANYVAQPTLSLSTCPTFVEAGIAPRHIDLRPFVLAGTSVQTVPGGLTRVALAAGSLVVNSSQGGGTKDTWVLEG